MKIIVTGATGFIGSALIQALLNRGDEVIALTRGGSRSHTQLDKRVTILEWHPPQPGSWMDSFRGADAVVNLAGEPVASKHWTTDQKQRILSSRIDATTAVVTAIQSAEPRPQVLINGSAIGYYGSQGSTHLTESSPPGSDFLASVVQSWEQAARPIEEIGVRLVLLRTGIVLGKEGGALPQIVLPFRLYAGGVMGEKDQFVSWIHLDDEIGIILYTLDHAEVRGIVNATAPHPVTMDVFSHQVGHALKRPAWVPMMGRAMRLALGERGNAVLASQRVFPHVIEAAGYQFKHSDSREALDAILK